MEIWFEFASTYSYPAVLRIEREASSRNVDISWKPFLLGPIFSAQGWKDSPFNIYPSKGAYMWRDIERICQKQNLPYSKPTIFPQNGLLAARVSCLYQTEAWVAEFIKAVFLANFAHGQDISSPEVIANILVSLGLDSSHLIESATSEVGKQKLRSQTQEAMERGLFGAPTFIVGAELFWGNDRLEDVLDWETEQAIDR